MEEIASLVICTVLADNIKIEVEKIDLKPDDIIVVRTPATTTQEDIWQLSHCISSMEFFDNRKIMMYADHFDLKKFTLEELVQLRDSFDKIIKEFQQNES